MAGAAVGSGDGNGASVAAGVDVGVTVGVAVASGIRAAADLGGAPCTVGVPQAPSKRAARTIPFVRAWFLVPYLRRIT